MAGQQAERSAAYLFEDAPALFAGNRIVLMIIRNLRFDVTFGLFVTYVPRS